MSKEALQHIPEPDRPLYDPPEQFLPELHPPPGAIDVLNIIEAGIEFKSTLNPDYATSYYKKPSFSKPSKIPYGKGINLVTQSGDEYCDGSADSFCMKGPKDSCLLAGTNDGRNGLMFDGFSGWTVLNIPDLRHGYIALKFETYHPRNANIQTTDWTSENNRTTLRGRSLKSSSALDYCDEFKFDFAIDETVTSWTKDEFLERLHQVQRVVETVTILKDPNYTGGEEKETEVAFRISGCGRQRTFLLTHVYWA